MGNCIKLPSTKIVNVVFSNGVEEEFKVRTTVEKITAGPYQGYDMLVDAQPHIPLPSDAKLRSGEVYYLIPSMRHHCNRKVSPQMVNHTSGESQKIKIVVTKLQLELLVRSAEEFHSQIMLRSFKDRGCYKWQPSLSTIPEL